MPSRRNRGKSGRKGFPAPADPAVARLPDSDLSLIDRHRFSWSFGSVDWDGPFGFRYARPNDVEAVFRLLSEVEHLSDNELKSGGHHPIPIGQLTPLAQERLRELGVAALRPPVAELWTFRLTRSKRVWFVPRGQKHLALLWWDPHHRVYATRGLRNPE